MMDGLKQKYIDGTRDPVDQQVQEAADEFVQLLAACEKAKERVERAKTTLLLTMQDRDIVECSVDGYKIKRVHKEEDKLRVVKVETITIE